MTHASLAWPGGADVCVALTFDVDADVGVGWRRIEERLTALSEARFGAVRGMPRILELLARRNLRATFYVPGEIAELHPNLIRAVKDGGHEIGHHGHLHLFPDKATVSEQRDEIERGFDALDRCVGVRPRGFRSPGWEMTHETFAILAEHGVAWDSSCMGDDRPYFESFKTGTMLELPVHWSLDDWVFYAFNRDSGGVMADPTALQRTWLLEFESALHERRMVTYTMHPEATGPGYRIRALDTLLDDMEQRANVWFATHGEVEALVRESQEAPA